MEHMSKNLMTNKVKEHIESHYSLTKILLRILILLELNIVLKMYQTKSMIIPSCTTFRIQYDDSIMCRFYCITFIEYMIPRKTLLNYTNLFPPNDY